MANLRAEMFNRRASGGRPDKILWALALKNGQKVADIGSGGGYFTWRFAEAVGPKGKVYAVDTDEKFLDFVMEGAKKKGLKNVERVFIKDGVPAIPEKIDLVFMRNVYHHLQDRVDYFKKLALILRPDARIAIIDYSKRRFGHYTAKEVIMGEMDKAGYQVSEVFDFLPGQSFAIFSKKK
jgi:arsenite methyltransferase